MKSGPTTRTRSLSNGGKYLLNTFSLRWFSTGYPRVVCWYFRSLSKQLFFLSLVNENWRIIGEYSRIYSSYTVSIRSVFSFEREKLSLCHMYRARHRAKNDRENEKLLSLQQREFCWSEFIDRWCCQKFSRSKGLMIRARIGFFTKRQQRAMDRDKRDASHSQKSVQMWTNNGEGRGDENRRVRTSPAYLISQTKFAELCKRPSYKVRRVKCILPRRP